MSKRVHIKCCPFCGDDVIGIYPNDKGYSWYAECVNCDSTGPRMNDAVTKSDAAMLWNCRSVYGIARIKKFAPCPFCGSTQAEKDHDGIKCSKCWAWSPVWNQRVLLNIHRRMPKSWVLDNYGWGGEVSGFEKGQCSVSTVQHWRKVAKARQEHRKSQERDSKELEC